MTRYNPKDEVAGIKVAIVGLGSMGEAIALRLQQVGFQIHLLRGTRSKKLDTLSDGGALLHENLSGIVQTSDVIITCLPHNEAVLAFSRQATSHLRAQSCWLECSTIDPKVAASVQNKFDVSTSQFLHSPFLGSPKKVMSGELVSIVGGSLGYENAALLILNSICREIIQVDSAREAAILKLLSNLVSQSTIFLLADTWNAAQRLGVSPELFCKVLASGAANSTTLTHLVIPCLLDQKRTVSFKLEASAKDIKYSKEMVARIHPELAKVLQEISDRADEIVSLHSSDETIAKLFAPIAQKK